MSESFADELPTGSRKAWKAFVEVLIAERVPLLLVGRHAPATSCAITSMATYVVGFNEESDRDYYWKSYRHLLLYDPDQVQLLYATPHRWTPFHATVEDREVLQLDLRRWDYKHQVLGARGVPPWRVFLWFKTIEVLMQTRPKVLARMLFHRDSDYRHAMRWYTRIGRRVWFHEVLEFVFRSRPRSSGPTLREFMGATLADREYGSRRCIARNAQLAAIGRKSLRRGERR